MVYIFFRSHFINTEFLFYSHPWVGEHEFVLAHSRFAVFIVAVSFSLAKHLPPSYTTVHTYTHSLLLFDLNNLLLFVYFPPRYGPCYAVERKHNNKKSDTVFFSGALRWIRNFLFANANEHSVAFILLPSSKCRADLFNIKNYTFSLWCAIFGVFFFQLDLLTEQQASHFCPSTDNKYNVETDACHTCLLRTLSPAHLLSLSFFRRLSHFGSRDSVCLFKTTIPSVLQLSRKTKYEPEHTKKKYIKTEIM